MRFSIQVVCVKFLIIAFLLASHAANAGLLVMKNGDRITGEIKRIWDAEVTIEPEYSDEFQVDVSAIDHVESSRNLQIELNDGQTVVRRQMRPPADRIQIQLTVAALRLSLTPRQPTLCIR